MLSSRLLGAQARESVRLLYGRHGVFLREVYRVEVPKLAKWQRGCKQVGLTERQRRNTSLIAILSVLEYAFIEG